MFNARKRMKELLDNPDVQEIIKEIRAEKLSPNVSGWSDEDMINFAKQFYDGSTPSIIHELLTEYKKSKPSPYTIQQEEDDSPFHQQIQNDPFYKNIESHQEGEVKEETRGEYIDRIFAPEMFKTEPPSNIKGEEERDKGYESFLQDEIGKYLVSIHYLEQQLQAKDEEIKKLVKILQWALIFIGSRKIIAIEDLEEFNKAKAALQPYMKSK